MAKKIKIPIISKQIEELPPKWAESFHIKTIFRDNKKSNIMTKKEIKEHEAIVEKQKKAAEAYFDKLDDLKGDKEFRKKARFRALGIATKSGLHSGSSTSLANESEKIYQWLIKVIK